MNKLVELKSMGFQITWKLIEIGLLGTEDIPVQLSSPDLEEYLNQLLYVENEQTDQVIRLICEYENEDKMKKLLHIFAEKDNSNYLIQLQKWKLYLLKQILDNIGQDSLKGLLELLEFWTSFGDLSNCPHIFPDPNKPSSAEEYFTDFMYEKLLIRNREWLDCEIKNIVDTEKKQM